MNDKVKNERIIKSGEMMQGICMQWFIDTHSSNKTAMKSIGLYTKILRYTFGYRQRFNYIKQERFSMFSQQLKSHRDILTNIGVLEWHTTKQMTMYKILEPVHEIKIFQFLKHTNDSTGSELIKKEELKQKLHDEQMQEIYKKM